MTEPSHLCQDPAIAAFLDAARARSQALFAEHFRAHAAGTNINETTLLTSDYINHFAGIVMLIEMLPQDPDGLAEAVLAFEPLDYLSHLERSGFRDRAMAARAYDYAPAPVREAFERSISAISADILALIGRIRVCLASGRPDCLGPICATATPALLHRITDAAAIANGFSGGSGERSHQPAIDAMMAEDVADTETTADAA